MPPVTRDKRARPHTTIFGKVVYKRKRHVFGDKDIFRILRSLLDNDIDHPGAYVAGLLVNIVRISLTIFRKTKKIRQFIIDLIKIFVPDLLDTLLQGAEDNYDNSLIALWNVLGSWMGGVKKSSKLTMEGQEQTEQVKGE